MTTVNFTRKTIYVISFLVIGSFIFEELRNIYTKHQSARTEYALYQKNVGQYNQDFAQYVKDLSQYEAQSKQGYLKQAQDWWGGTSIDKPMKPTKPSEVGEELNKTFLQKLGESEKLRRYGLYMFVALLFLMTPTGISNYVLGLIGKIINFTLLPFKLFVRGINFLYKILVVVYYVFMILMLLGLTLVVLKAMRI